MRINFTFLNNASHLSYLIFLFSFYQLINANLIVVTYHQPNSLLMATQLENFQNYKSKSSIAQLDSTTLNASLLWSSQMLINQMNNEPIWQTGGRRNLTHSFINWRPQWRDSLIFYDSDNSHASNSSYNELIDFTIDDTTNFTALYVNVNDSKDLDSKLSYLLKKYEAIQKLNNKIDLLILLTSSRIASQLEKNSSALNALKKIFIEDLIDLNLISMWYGTTKCISLFISSSSTNQTLNHTDFIYESLKNLNTVEIIKVDRSNSTLLGDLILKPREGYELYFNRPSNNSSILTSLTLLGHGPSFKQDFEHPSAKMFNFVDIYNLISTVLDRKISNGADYMNSNNINDQSPTELNDLLCSSYQRFITLYIIISLTPVLTASITALALCLINRNTSLPGQLNTSNLDNNFIRTNGLGTAVRITNKNGYHMLSTSDMNLHLLAENDDEL